MVEHEGSNEKPLSVQLPAVRASLDQAGRDAPCTLSELQTATVGHDGAKEEWREVVGTSGRYEVSNLGRVRSRAARGHKTSPIVLKQGDFSTGYLGVHIAYSKEKNRHVNVSHLVAEAFLGPRPPGMLVAHKNGKRRDNRASNLLYCTPKENQLHAIVHGTLWRQGPNHSLAKMTYEKAEEVRQRYANGETTVQLSEVFGITAANIGHIVNRNTYVSHEEKAARAINEINAIRAGIPIKRTRYTRSARFGSVDGGGNPSMPNKSAESIAKAVRAMYEANQKRTPEERVEIARRASMCRKTNIAKRSTADRTEGQL